MGYKYQDIGILGYQVVPACPVPCYVQGLPVGREIRVPGCVVKNLGIGFI
jgi:hypothetical protein